MAPAVPGFLLGLILIMAQSVNVNSVMMALLIITFGFGIDYGLWRVLDPTVTIWHKRLTMAVESRVEETKKDENKAKYALSVSGSPGRARMNVVLEFSGHHYD